METHNKIANLIIKYRDAGLNEQEQRELDEWIALSDSNRQTFEHLTDESYMKVLSEIDVRAERRKIKEMYALCRPIAFGIRPLASHETPWQHSKIPHRCDTRRHGRNGDHKRGRRRVL